MEEKELIVEKQSQENAKKITFQKWVKGIVHYKWWVIGGTLGLGLVGALGTQFGINSITEKLTADYSYNLATFTDEDGVERYVDGTLFNYATIVSENVMEEVKESNSKFSKINISKLVSNNAISVAREVKYQTNSSGSVIASSKSVTYTITAKAKYFPSKSVGKDFVKSLIYYLSDASSNAIERYNVTSYITDSFSNLSLRKKIGAMKSQYTTINDIYTSLDEKFGGYVIGNNQDQTLAQIISDFTTNASIDVLVNSFYANGYVDYESGNEAARIAEIKEEAKANIKILGSKQNELDVAKELLQTMQSATMISTLDSESEYSKELIKIKNQISALSLEIDEMVKDLHWAGYYEDASGEYVFDDTDTNNACYQLATLDADWVNKNAIFANDLLSASETLENERKESTTVYKYLYSRYNNGVSILNSGSVQVKGNVSWAIGLVVGLVFGFLITSFVTAEVEVNKEKKEE